MKRTRIRIEKTPVDSIQGTSCKTGPSQRALQRLNHFVASHECEGAIFDMERVDPQYQSVVRDGSYLARAAAYFSHIPQSGVCCSAPDGVYWFIVNNDANLQPYGRNA